MFSKIICQIHSHTFQKVKQLLLNQSSNNILRNETILQDDISIILLISEIIQNKDIQQVLSTLGKEYHLSAVISNIIKAQSGEYYFHIDYPYSNKLEAIQLLIPFQNIDYNNGCTIFMNDKEELYPLELSINNNQNENIINIEIGWWESRIKHSSGINKSNEDRIAIVVNFVSNHIEPRNNIADMLSSYNNLESIID